MIVRIARAKVGHRQATPYLSIPIDSTQFPADTIRGAFAQQQHQPPLHAALPYSLTLIHAFPTSCHGYTLDNCSAQCQQSGYLVIKKGKCK